jgi:hypothetical protein
VIVQLDGGIARRFIRKAINRRTNRRKTMPKRKLPPDPEKMNGRHAECAGAAVHHYQSVTSTDCEAAIGGLLADLMHWSDRNNFDFELALSRAQGHDEAETSATPVGRVLQFATEGR